MVKHALQTFCRQQKKIDPIVPNISARWSRSCNMYTSKYKKYKKWTCAKFHDTRKNTRQHQDTLAHKNLGVCLNATVSFRDSPTVCQVYRWSFTVEFCIRCWSLWHHWQTQAPQPSWKVWWALSSFNTPRIFSSQGTCGCKIILSFLYSS